MVNFLSFKEVAREAARRVARASSKVGITWRTDLRNGFDDKPLYRHEMPCS